MSKSLSHARAMMALEFLNTPYAGIGDAQGLPGSGAPGYVYLAALSTNPGSGGDVSGELDFTGYARVSVSRSTAGFTLHETLARMSNAYPILFPRREDAGDAQTCNYVAVMSAASGGVMLRYCAVSTTRSISQDQVLMFAAGALTFEYIPIEDLGSGYSPDAWYGVQWDITVPATPMTRIGRVDLITAQPIYNKIKTGLVTDDRNVNYYLDPTNDNFKEDGTPSVLTGADGQVMVIPPRYYFLFESAGNVCRLKISEYPLAGFSYWSTRIGYAKYLASIDGGGKMASVSGVMPATSYACGFTANSFGARARARGTGWTPVTEYMDLQMQILELVYTADWNAQSVISTGATNASSTDWSARNYGAVKNNGNSNSLGRFTGSSPFTVADWYVGTTTAVAASKCIDSGRFASWSASYIGMTIRNTTTGATATILAKDSNDQISISADIFTAIGQNFLIVGTTFSSQSAVFAGIEDYFGHLYQWRPGVLFNANATPPTAIEAFRCIDPALAADSITADYASVGFLPLVDGYIIRVLPGTMLPEASGGSSTTYMCDFYYHPTTAGVRILLAGGPLHTGANAGPRFAHAISAPGYSSASIGSRLGLTFND